MVIKIGEYFGKYGFGDGDDEELLRQAEEMRPRVVELLNVEFQQRGLPYRAVEVDYRTVHNPIRMCLQWKKGGKRYEWEDAEIFKEAPAATIAMMEKAGRDCPAGVEEVFRIVQKKLTMRRSRSSGGPSGTQA